MTSLQKTLEIMEGMMNSICDWLNFTMESVDDFGGKLPTLDLSIWIREDNIILYIFFQKPMASSMVIQKRSAMPENMRVATLNQEMIRRMLNTSERLEIKWRTDVVDDYAGKLINSGYDIEYTRKVIVGGLTGYERKVILSKDKSNPKWKPLHQGAKFDASGRRKRKLLAKKNWFKKRKEDDDPPAEDRSPAKRRKQSTEEENQDDQSPKTLNASGASQEEECINMQTASERNIVREDNPSEITNTRPKEDCINMQTASERNKVRKKKNRKRVGPDGGIQKTKAFKDLETLAVMFVEQTKGGVWQKKLQEAEDSVAMMVGYRVRVVESSSTQLGRLLPCTNPWKGQHCGRPSCYTCEQGGDELQNCRQRNVLYESICNVCNPNEGSEEEKKTDKFEKFKEQAGVYVGETSRSIFERAGEHRRDAEGEKEDSHMFKHWKMIHPELPEPPGFKINLQLEG